MQEQFRVQFNYVAEILDKINLIYIKNAREAQVVTELCSKDQSFVGIQNLELAAEYLWEHWDQSIKNCTGKVALHCSTGKHSNFMFVFVAVSGRCAAKLP